MPLNEAETLAQVMGLISLLCCLGWAGMGMRFSMSMDSRMATQNFSVANALLVLGGFISKVRSEQTGFIEYFQRLNLADVCFLTAVVFFRSGMRALHGLPCTTAREYKRVALAAGLVILVAHRLGIPNAAGAGAYLAGGWFALLGLYECNQVLKRDFGAVTRWAFMWPILAAGVLFILRATDDSLALVFHGGDVSNTMKVKHFVLYLWAQMLVNLLVNASLIGQTLNILIKKLQDQAHKLQGILDTAPVGVAVTTDGVVRFVNPRITDLLDMKVGDPAAKSLVNPIDEERVVGELRDQGQVIDREVQMYCPNHTIRDLLVTYLPTEYDGKPGLLAWIIDITERKKSEKKVLFNRTVVENAEPMFWADPTTWKLVYGNKAGLALMETSADELLRSEIPAQFLTSMPEGDRSTLREKMHAMSRPHRFRAKHVRKGGEEIFLDVSAYIAEDEERSLMVASMRDMTAQARAEMAMQHANAEQSAIFEAATLGITFVKDGAIVRANQRMQQLFGWDCDALQGPFARTWWATEELALDALYHDIATGGVHNSTQQLQRRDGSRFWCRLSGTAIDPKDLARGTVWMFDDVTAEREAAELMRSAKELAEEATRMKSDFLANMSHEIRTPMNAIVGMSHLALQTDLSPKQRNYIEKVDAAARSLLGIINDILDFSKIEAGKLRFEQTEFHLEDVMENVADLCVIKAQDKGIELLFDVGPDVPTALIGDSLRLGQVILNLVGNGIKFTERGEVTLTVRMASGSGLDSTGGTATLFFEVADTGVGLSSEQRSKLFDAFSQADASTTRKYGGTGLGLTISKRLVEMMGGSIGVESTVGEGSKFFFTACFGLQSEQRTPHVLEKDVLDLRILVVDDNARAREIMLAILQSQKFEATAVQSGELAMHALKQASSEGRPYGLVLMDWMMPGMDGLTTIQKIRSHPELHATPAFVMVTAHSRDELFEHARDTRIDGVLLKPVGPSAVLDSILSALGKAVVTRGRKRQREEANLEAESKLRGAYVLLVEDNAVNQELALEILQEAGLRVDVASNGAQAVGMVHRASYDGVLMDCQMPVLDGFAATRQIRSDGRFANLPILAMTANAMSGDRELCIQAGMNDHIGKPIDVKQLFTTMARWISPQAQLASEEAVSRQVQNDDPLPSIAGLDLVLALRRLGGNRSLLRKLILRFTQTQSGASSRIAAALSTQDRTAAALEAHTTKGLAGNIGAGRMFESAQILERALRNAAQNDVTSELSAFDAALRLVLADIGNAIAPDTSASDSESANSERMDDATLRVQLRQLAALLADDDSDAGKLVDIVALELQQRGQLSSAANIRKLMGRYDFEGALQVLEGVASALGIDLSRSGDTS